ncbi:hypothetical protein PENTCL1PPCAC_28791, partial [Pristionchus entomophagus]
STTASISAPSPIAHLQHMVAGGPGGSLGMSSAMPPPMHPPPMNHQMMSPMMSPAPPMLPNSQSMPYRTQMASPHAPQAMMTPSSMGGSMMASPLSIPHSMHPSTSMSMMTSSMASTSSMMRPPTTTMPPSTYQQSLMSPHTTSSPTMGGAVMMMTRPGQQPQPMQHSPHLQHQPMQPSPQQQQHLKDAMRPGPGSMTPTPAGLPPPGGPPMQHQMPTPTPIEFRIHDMNRRFYLFLNTGVQEKDYAQWWDAFSHEFFDEEAKMTFELLDGTGKPTEKYVIGRKLIPRYFRTLLDGGMNEMYYVIKGGSRELPNPDGLTTYECNTFMQVSKYETPYQSEIQTDANIKLEFTPYEELYNYRIRSWHIQLHPSQEFSFNPITREFAPVNPERGGAPTRPVLHGMSHAAHQALQFSVILEPMSMIMSTCKGQPQLTPQEALKRICFARHQQQQQQQQALMMNAQNAQMMQQQQPAEETKAKPTRKRQRKTPANPKGAKKGGAAGGGPGAIQSPAPPVPGVPGGGFVPPQGMPPMHFPGMPEVFVVGEPSMLGGEFREDERTIDKIENPNYDPNAAMRHPPGGAPGMMAPPQMQQQQPPGGAAAMQQLQQQQHHQLLGGPSPQQGQQPPPQHLMGVGPHGSMGPPMMPQQQGGPTPPGLAGGMPNGLPPPGAGYEYIWSRPPTNSLIGA